MPDYNVPHVYLSQFLSTDGAGGGQVDAIGDYSSSEGIFYITPPAGHKYFISRIIVFIEDIGAFDSGKYGKDLVLGSGVNLTSTVSGNTRSLTPIPVLTNSQWGQYCYDISLHSFGGGQVNGVMVVRWTATKALPPGLDALDANILMLHENDVLEMHLNDDFSNLVGHRFIVQGVDVYGA